MRNLEEFNGFHKGKTAFILGAGPSLGMVDLSPLKEYVTIAVNSSYAGFPEADYFISDDHSVANWSFFFNTLRASTKTIALLYENMLKNQAWQFGNRSVLFRHRKGYHITDSYHHNRSENHICQARTSVGSAIHVAHIMGCSKIVLIGIDCCRYDSLRYFWGQRGFEDRPFRNDKIPEDRYRRATIKGIQTDTDLVEIQNYWKDKSKYFNEKCNILNASPISVLEDFDKIDLQSFLQENKEGKKHV